MKDPVCNMDVHSDKFTLEKRENRLFFCSKGCREKYKANPKEFSGDYVYDLIIVGAGPAGLTAAVYASTLRINTFLVSMDIGGQAVDTSKIVNYMGFDFVSGPELIQKFKNQLLHHHYINHRIDVVSSIKKKDNIFHVSLISGKQYHSYALIIATGMQRRQLKVPGEKELLRRGVTYSLSQDLQIFARKTVVVVGGGNSALQAAIELTKYNCKIILVSIMSWTADPIIQEELEKKSDLLILNHHKVVEITGKDTVEGVVVQNLVDSKETFHEAGGVLIAIGHLPNSIIVDDLVELNDRKEIVIDREYNTKTPGLFACGDVTDVMDKRVVIASGEGAKATLAAKRFINKRKT